MIISYSEVKSGQACMYRYYYQYGLGLVPKHEGNAINAGHAGHSIMKVFYRAIRNGSTRQDALELARLELDKYTSLHDFNERAVRAWALAEHYISNLSLKGTPVLVDEPLQLDLTSEYGFKIGFTPDLLWDDVVEDYKFVGKAWSNNKQDRYSQLDLYTVFLRMMGYTVNRAVLRFFNLQTNKVTQKTIDINPTKLNTVFNDFVKKASELRDFKELPVAAQRLEATRTFDEGTCNWCKYILPCTYELSGLDASKTLSTQFRENTTYGYR